MEKYRKAIVTTTIVILLSSCSPATIEPTPTSTVTATIIPSNTPTEVPPTLTATAEPTKTPEPPQCPLPPGGTSSSWERYTPNTFENIGIEADQVSARDDNPGISMYIEAGGEHQIPSCVIGEYTGIFREIPQERMFLIEAWSGIFGPEQSQQIMALLQHEVLLIENGQEYWLPVQESLIPYMENELTKNEPAIVFIIWAGSSFLSEETDHILIINEFTNPQN